MVIYTIVFLIWIKLHMSKTKQKYQCHVIKDSYQFISIEIDRV